MGRIKDWTWMFLWVTTVMSLQAGAPSYQVQQVPIEHQLGIEITAITQDHKGFMWIGTNNGLWRYDGRSYRHFTKRAGSEHEESISSKMVTCLFVDKRGTLWVGTEYGLVSYDQEEESFDWHLDIQEDIQDKVTNVYDITQDAFGRIWVATKLGLTFYDPENDESTHFEESIPGEGTVTRLLRDEEGIWAGTPYGLVLLDHEGRVGKAYPFDKPGWVNHLARSAGQKLWVVRGGELTLFNPRRTASHYRAESINEKFSFRTVMEMPQGELWAASDSGLIHRYKNKLPRLYQADPTNPNNLSFPQVTALFQSREGILWVGTKAGLNKVHNKGPHFTQIRKESGKQVGLGGSQVRAVHTDSDGGLWVGTPKGLSIRPAGSRKFLHLETENEIWSQDAGGVIQLVADDKDQMWVSTYSRVFVIDTKTREIINRIDLPKKSEFVSMVSAHGSVWAFGDGWDSILRYDIKNFSARVYESIPPEEPDDERQRFWFLVGDNTGDLWVSASDGLLRYDAEQDTLVKVIDQHHLEETPNAIHKDREGIYWMATGKGLQVYDPEKDKFKTLDKEHGLFSQNIYGLMADHNGYFWMSHPLGITRFQPSLREGIHYTLDDGLNNKFNWSVYHKAGNGQIYFGGGNGLTSLDPDNFGKNTRIPQLVVTEVDASNFTLEKETAFKENKELRLEEGDYVVLEVAVLDYTNPQKNMISYKLEGFNKMWSQPMTDREIILSGLPPGNYKLRIIGANNDGVWNKEGTTLFISVHTPWWMTTPAVIFFLMLIPTGLFLLYRLKVRHMRRREEALAALIEERTHELRVEKEKTEAQAQKLLEMDQLKTQFFANVSHEFRTPLTLIIGPLETMLSEGEGEVARRRQRHEVMLRNSRRLLRLINQLLDITKLEAGKMNLLARPGDLHSFAKPMVYAFHSLAEKKDMKLFLDAEEGELEVFFDPEKLEKVFFNLISNAFQYTGHGGEIRVSIKGERDATGRKQAHVIVADSGEGIPAEDLPYLFDRFRQADGSTTRKREGTGIGLALVKELVQLHGGKVWLESRLGEGTEAHFTLPLGRSHLPRESVVETQIDDQYVLPNERVDIELANLQESTYTPIQTNSGTETLLIVDDLADVRAYIREAFPDYRVVEAVDGEHGLQTARKVKPDLIISDVMMPVMDGYAFCREVKKDRELSHTPLILLTAKASEDMKVEGLEIGADDYLSKPFNVRELRVRVRNLLHMRAQERGLRRSLEMAHRAQISMLPAAVPKLPGLDIAAYCQPASEVGGDYYDFVEMPDEKLGVVIGDVSGKGMPAALYMTMTKGLVQAYSQKSNSPCEMLTRINRQFQKASTANTFISLLYAVVDLKTRKMVYSSAGHNPMVLCRDGETQILKSHGMAVGLESGKMFDRIVRDEEFLFQPGDLLVMYTDGLTDAQSASHESFGEKRLENIVQRCGHLGADNLMSEIKTAYTDFVGDCEQFDDLTAVVIKIPEAA